MTITASYTGPELQLEQSIVDDLFLEQDTRVLGQLYRHGVLRTVFVLGRALLFTRGGWVPAREPIAPASTVAVVFFPNERQAVASAAPHVQVDQILQLDLTSLPLIRTQLGLVTMTKEAVRFLATVLRRRGLRYLGRSSIPLLGWLLYKAFRSLLQGQRAVTIITTNMQHPTSIGVHWAARLSGLPAVFLEHATTPALVFRDRGYERLLVNFEHTCQMMIARGAAPARVHVMRAIARGRAVPRAKTLRTAGVCINDLDSSHAVAEVTEVLQRRGFAVTYRLHDADPRLGYFRRQAERLGIGFSSARGSRIESFLATVDLVVAGNSNVVADALIAGKPVVYYWSGDEQLFDYYGFVGYYELPHARTKLSLDAMLSALQGAGPTC